MKTMPSFLFAIVFTAVLAAEKIAAPLLSHPGRPPRDDDQRFEGRSAPGRRYHEVNRETVSTLPELRAASDRQKEGEPLVLQVECAGKIRYVEVD